jgi:hypothetical protein
MARKETEMRNLIVLASLIVASAAAHGQNTLVGKWHGTDRNLPIIDLDVEQNAGRASGTAIFYVLKRNSDGSNLHVDGQGGGPMENVNYAPNQVLFTVRRTDGSVASYRLVLDDEKHATLLLLGEPEAPHGTAFPLVRVAENSR